MTCPACGAEKTDRCVRTNDLGGITFRQRECACCGARWTTHEVLFQGVPVATGSLSARARAQRPPPMLVSASPCAPVAQGGVGGGVSSGSGPVLDLVRIPSSRSTEVLSKRSTGGSRRSVEYPDEFERIWDHTGKRGAKEPAFLSWVKRGRPPLDAVARAWDAYMLSDRPAAGYVKDLVAWFNQGCHAQEWVPAHARVDSAQSRKSQQAELELREIIRQQQEQEAANAGRR